MQMLFGEFSAAAPEITLLALICVVLIADLFVKDEQKVVTVRLSIASLVVTAWTVFAIGPPLPATIFDGSYISDALSQVLKLAAILVVAVGFLYSRDYLRQNNLLKGEFFLLGLFGLLGIMIMISANSMLIMYLGLETLSLSLYALVAYERNSAAAAESAMKYFVLGAIASGSLLYGISWIYGLTGSLQFPEIAAAVQSGKASGMPLYFGLAFLITGIGFKFGAVPFHMWLPDVYQGARTPVTLYIASAPKLAALALFLRVMVDGLGDLHGVWQDRKSVV